MKEICCLDIGRNFTDYRRFVNSQIEQNER
jgi:hypothetical protein